jgi:hypothetical protein
MKNAYLNNVFISGLYLPYKNTPKQKTQQKNRTREENIKK